MEQSPWEANRFAASQEIPHFMEPKGSPYSKVSISILSQLNPVHTRNIPIPEDPP
jgi:hypothetical protein